MCDLVMGELLGAQLSTIKCLGLYNKFPHSINFQNYLALKSGARQELALDHKLLVAGTAMGRRHLQQ